MSYKGLDMGEFLKPLLIKNVKIKNNIMFAPLAGISLQPVRLYMKKFGAGLTFTEMISSHGLIYQNKKTKDMIDISNKERPVGVQIFGNKAEILGDAAKIVQDMGADLIDINMGCPATKVVKSMSGSALLKDLNLVKQIVKIVVSRVKVPVTVKIRAGWDEKSVNAREASQIIEGEGASMITVHARTRAQKFNEFNWDIIKQVKEAVKIPVIGNGSVFTPQDALRMFKETNCDGIMLARAPLTNPWIFTQIIDFLKKGKFKIVTPEERLKFILEFSKKFVKYSGEEKGIYEVRKFIAWLSKGLPNSSELRKECFKTKTLKELIDVIKFKTKNL
jgi:tRNA-dihydrouridine synthase B